MTAATAQQDPSHGVVDGQARRWRRALAWEERVQRAAHPLVYPAIRSLRRLGPAVRVPGLGVVVSDAAVAREVLLNSEVFSKVGPGAPSDLWTPILGPSVLLNMEGADHAALRRALSGIFTPRSVAELTRLEAGAALDRLGERLAAGERVDIVDEVAVLAGTVVCRLTGIPTHDDAVRDTFRRAQSIVGMVRLHRRTFSPDQVRRAREVLAELSEPARAAYRTGDPSTVPGRMRELGLSEHEAMGAVGAFVLTGTETIQSFVPRLITLTHDAGWLPRLLATESGDPLRSRIVEETLRVTAPTPVMLRAVRADGEVAGIRVRAGDRVVIATISCCRAGGPFAPDLPADPTVRNLWFGAGPHFCLGMPLAMAQIDAVVEALRPAIAGRAGTGGAGVPGGRELRVVDRSVARGVLIPSYRSVELEVR